MKDHNRYYVYILSSQTGILYTGVTNDLVRRVLEHKEGLVKGFSKKYKTVRLVYYKETPDVKSAIEEEKRIKGLTRRKKLALIRTLNPQFEDLWKDIN